MNSSKSPTVELSMIVKDGGTDLERCLQSAVPFVDRILIGDTGSTDGSQQRARRFGAEVIEFPWENDFAKARNRVLAHCKCDWVLVLDADDMLDPIGGARISELIQSPNLYAYHHSVWNYVTKTVTRIGDWAAVPNTFPFEHSQPYPSYVPTPTIRLFRNYPGLEFDGCVHETLVHRLAALNLPSANSDFIVHHFGFVHDSGQARQIKNDIYHALGEDKLRRMPNDPQALQDLGISELEHRKNPASALGYFEKARQIGPQLARLWLYSGICLSRLQRGSEALEYLDHASSLGLQTGVLYQAIGDTHFQMENFALANQAYTTMAERGDSSPIAEAKRGVCQVRLGQVVTGIARIQRVVAESPDAAELYDILATTALLVEDLPLAVQTMQARVRLGNLTSFHTQLVSVIQAKFNQQRQASLAVA
jgi:tetratricopeptide (TPR) repeat protein